MNPWIHGHLLRYYYMIRARSLKMVEEKTEHQQRGFVDDFGTGSGEMIQFGECAAGGNHSCPDGGLSSVPPDGPAIPDVATAHCV